MQVSLGDSEDVRLMSLLPRPSLTGLPKKFYNWSITHTTPRVQPRWVRLEAALCLRVCVSDPNTRVGVPLRVHRYHMRIFDGLSKINFWMFNFQMHSSPNCNS